MSKAAVPSRIPKFGSRIPQISPSRQPEATSPTDLITRKHLGQKVRFGEKEGILRFVGGVHFTCGVWCGIELYEANGKNDGFVNGVRYFACPPQRGLMAPLNKVSLINNSENEPLADDPSGPYSMLFTEQQLAANSSHVNINKSCDDLDVKRRRTSKNKQDVVLDIEKPSSLQQNLLKFHSTSLHTEITESVLLRKLQSSFEQNSNLDEDSSKRDSLEFEESSLGILTPDQMIDYMSFPSTSHSRSSLEYIKQNSAEKQRSKSELSSPKELNLLITDKNPVEDVISPNPSGTTDYSFGIIDDRLLANLTLKTDATMNMELPLDACKDYKLTRLDLTPSPEELPLDPTPVVDDRKVSEVNNKKTGNSFITSITSITSLDTGYQGDGEMSRPASREADNSPLTRRPIPRSQQISRRPDPMTDSDFYTESEADNHEENVLRGDRRAQVIDGTLYGVDPQAAADIYVNNRENMDSSGIFTDLDTRTDDLVLSHEQLDVSPSDVSSKTISENSQNHEMNDTSTITNTPTPTNNYIGGSKKSLDKSCSTSVKESPNTKKRIASSPVNSSSSCNMSPRHLNSSKNDSSSAKKYKMPNREVVSKVKSMMDLNRTSPVGSEKKVKKITSRWDAVMSKISKNDENKNNLKDVKSKVCTNVGGILRQQDPIRNKVTARTNTIQKMPNNKSRRMRSCATTASSSPKNTPTSKSLSSNHSSISDLSVNCNAKKGSSAKKEAQVTQVLTASKLTPRPQIEQNNIENKKNAGTAITVPKSKRPIFPKEKVAVPRKECGRSTVKGGGTVPTARSQQQNRTPAAKPPAKVTEGLAILVQHLVFNVGAYQVPTLRRQLENYRLEVEEFKLACQQLEKSLSDEKLKQNELIEKERVRCRSDIAQVIDQHQIEITKLKTELEERFRGERQELHEKFNQQLQNERTLLKTEFTKLQKTHQETVDILGEENDAIREQIDEKNQQLENVKHESMKLKQDYESREQNYKKQMVNLMETIKELEEEKKHLIEENNRLLGYGDDKAIGMQEVQSLRAVLELKQSEVAELRRALAAATQKADTLQGAEEKGAALLARCEDLQLQLQRKSEYEQNLISENQRLQVSLKEEMNQKRRLLQYNEELQWKLKQNKEVMNKVLEQTHTDDSVFIRSSLSSSYNERHSATKQQFERTLSFRERNSHSNKLKNSLDFDMDEDLSPPTSPKVKIMVKKCDSVSYVLDLDESPELQAQRIVRRSFRNTATPSKSPTNKRARIRNPLSLSASSSAILQTSKCEQGRTRTISLQNGECEEEEERFFSNGATSTPKSDNKMKLELDEEDEDDVIQLPALPSEIGGSNKKLIVLPSPKHLAGEAMVSESNSEDESSTSSSQL